jgi:hypothetical protein
MRDENVNTRSQWRALTLTIVADLLVRVRVARSPLATTQKR